LLVQKADAGGGQCWSVFAQEGSNGFFGGFFEKLGETIENDPRERSWGLCWEVIYLGREGVYSVINGPEKRREIFSYPLSEGLTTAEGRSHSLTFLEVREEKKLLSVLGAGSLGTKMGNSTGVEPQPPKKTNLGATSRQEKSYNAEPELILGVSEEGGQL